MFLESIKHNQMDDQDSYDQHPSRAQPLDNSNTPISNETLSNLAFLDLSNDEKATLEAKYKALGQENDQAQEDSAAGESDKRQKVKAEPPIF